MFLEYFTTYNPLLTYKFVLLNNINYKNEFTKKRKGNILPFIKVALDPSIVKRVFDNYVPHLHISEDEKQNILSSHNDEKTKQFCEKVFTQNENLLTAIAENYQHMTELVNIY